MKRDCKCLRFVLDFANARNRHFGIQHLVNHVSLIVFIVIQVTRANCANKQLTNGIQQLQLARDYVQIIVIIMTQVQHPANNVMFKIALLAMRKTNVQLVASDIN